MKRRFSKILGVGLTLALITSLLLTAAPVSADVSQPTVDLSHATTDGDDISEEDVIYTIAFRINKELLEGADTTITVRFQDDTDVAGATVAVVDPFGVSYTSGIGYSSGEATTVGLDIDTDDLTVEITLTALDPDNGIGAMAYVQVVIGGITNPTETGTYTLEVKTSEEDDYVVSESYDIGAPVVGGFVYVYNPSNILLATYGGKLALDGAAAHFAKADYTIKVGPGSYDLAGDIIITGEGLTFESSAGAEDTIINADLCSGAGIYIYADDVTVDGFTIDDSPVDGIVINYGTTGVTVENNIITEAAWSGVALAYDARNTTVRALIVAEATVSGNVMEDCGAGINVAGCAVDNTISDNTITGSSDHGISFEGGIFGQVAEGNTITGNTITANECVGIRVKESNATGLVTGTENTSFFADNVIEANTISENEGPGILIDATITDASSEDEEEGEEWGTGDGISLPLTGLDILNNDILDNEEEGILIESVSWDVSNIIKFNTITGNDDDGIISDLAVDATFNWWGTTVADDIGDMVSEDVTYEPFLTDTAEAAIVGGAAAGGTSSLDAKTECGVKVSGVVEDTATDPKVADVISAFKYAANPEEAIDDAIAFYDVYVALPTDFDTDEVEAKLKFYDTAITAGSTVSFWTGDYWDDCSLQEARAGLIWVAVTEDTSPFLEELEGTPFVVVAGEVVTEFGAPLLLSPTVGADDVSLTPTFAWGAVTGADGYYFEFADNANFVTPLVKLDGDLGRLIVTAYAYVTELPYSIAYYWRVKAVSGTEAAGDLEESGWASGVFITMAEPEEAIPPVVIEPYEPPIITIEQPDIIVPLPDVSEITPSWIYVIIGVGAVLVIGLIVLIVRTRRVA